MTSCFAKLSQQLLYHSSNYKHTLLYSFDIDILILAINTEYKQLKIVS